MKRTSRFSKCVLLVLLGIFCGCKDYQKTMQTKLRSVVGKDARDYFWFSYPTDNYGLGTMYATSATIRQLNLDTNFLCASATCLRVDPIPSDSLRKALSLSGYADIGEGADISLSERESSKIATSIVLPTIYNLISVSGKEDLSRSVSTSISVGSAFARKLVRPKMYNYLNTLPNDDFIKKVYDSGQLSVAVSDLVISTISVSIVVTNNLDSSISATLDANVGKVIGKGAGLTLQVTKSATGTYSFTSTHPLIVAVQYRRLTPGDFLMANIKDTQSFSYVIANTNGAGGGTSDEWADFSRIQLRQ